MPGKLGQLVTLQEPQVQALEERGLAVRTQHHKVKLHRYSRTLRQSCARGRGHRESGCMWMKDGGRKSTMCRALETGRTKSSQRDPTKIFRTETVQALTILLVPVWDSLPPPIF